MCGIAGIICPKNWSAEDNVSMAKKLLLGIEVRGHDATGYATITNGEINVDKAAMTASLFVKRKMVGSPVMLLHTRAATNGSPQNNVNNHPIMNKKYNSVIVHNGIVQPVETLPADGDCDSEQILQWYHKAGLKNGIKKLFGSMAFAIYHDKKVYLYRNSNPLIVAYLPKRNMYVFASTYEAIMNALPVKKKSFGLFTQEQPVEDIAIKELEDGEGLIFDLVTGRVKKFTATSAISPPNVIDEPNIPMEDPDEVVSMSNFGSWKNVKGMEFSLR